MDWTVISSSHPYTVEKDGAALYTAAGGCLESTISPGGHLTCDSEVDYLSVTICNRLSVAVIIFLLHPHDSSISSSWAAATQGAGGC